MGPLTGLATLPVATVRVVWIAEQVAEEADRQLYDEASIRREMLQLELDYQDGKIDLHERRRYEGAAAGASGDQPGTSRGVGEGGAPLGRRRRIHRRRGCRAMAEQRKDGAGSQWAVRAGVDRARAPRPLAAARLPDRRPRS